MTPPSQTHRFLRRIAFAQAPGQPAPADPLAWALAQVDTPPPVVLRTASGPRTDLPAEARLLSKMSDVMTAYRDSWNAVDAFFSLDPAMPQAQRQQKFRELVGWRWRDFEHWKETQARLSTALHGPQPVFERFWHFWTNHFMVAPNTDNNDALVGPYQRALREHLSGSFRDLLWNAVTHPGMLAYLDNYRNTGPNSPWRRQGRTQDSVNENLGRELLELFTVTPAAGYTQADVEQATLVLTGWTMLLPPSSHPRPLFPSAPNVPASMYGTFFSFQRHEPGEQTVMGKRYAFSAFRQKGKLEDLVTDLAEHPATAAHIALKLCRHFLGDQPDPAQVAQVEKTFRESRGHLPTVHKAVVRAAWDSAETHRKFLNPETWLVQAHRLLQLDLPQDAPVPAGAAPVTTSDLLRDLGQALPHCPQPNGWPIRSDEWISRELLDRRVRMAQWLAARSPLCQPGRGEALLAVAAEELGTSAPEASAVRQAIAQGDLQRAAVLMLASPRLLWA